MSELTQLDTLHIIVPVSTLSAAVEVAFQS